MQKKILWISKCGVGIYLCLALQANGEGLDDKQIFCANIQNTRPKVYGGISKTKPTYKRGMPSSNFGKGRSHQSKVPPPMRRNQKISPQNQQMAQQSTSDLQRYENYLNQINSLQASFTQISPRGKQSQGMLYLQRPGKVRLIYHPEGTLELIANGNWLIQYDGKNDEVTYVALDSTPLYFLLQPRVAFRSQARVHHIVKDAKWGRLVLSSKQDPESGTITLIFQENPLELVRWIIREPNGGQTTVNLSNMKKNIGMPSGRFDFQDPKVKKRLKTPF